MDVLENSTEKTIMAEKKQSAHLEIRKIFISWNMIIR